MDIKLLLPYIVIVHFNDNRTDDDHVTYNIKAINNRKLFKITTVKDQPSLFG